MDWMAVGGSAVLAAAIGSLLWTFRPLRADERHRDRITRRWLSAGVASVMSAQLLSIPFEGDTAWWGLELALLAAGGAMIIYALARSRTSSDAM